MTSETDMSRSRRIPTLVQLCQRVASANVELMSSLGDMPIDLVRPILHNCPADVLDKLEQATPSLCQETPDMWKSLCFHDYPLIAEQQCAAQDPDSWREAYFSLRDFEKQRLEAVAARLRIKREEERKRKEGSQIKYTDKLPPAKRSRTSGWGQSQPKTLFQKTRSDAVKMQKGIYGARMAPSMPLLKPKGPLLGTTGVKPTNTSNNLLSPSNTSSSGNTGTRVTVASVPKARPSGPSRPTTSSQSSTTSTATNLATTTPHPPAKATPGAVVSAPRTTQPTQSSRPPAANFKPSPLKVRKDPMTSIFMPKSRAYPVVPTHSAGMRSRA